MVLPANYSNGWVHYWAGRCPGIVGHLYSPGGQRGPYPWLPFALDNGAYAGFDAARWVALLRWACLSGGRPLWVAVPDVVGDAKATRERWEQYSPEAARFGWPLAWVAQDGAAIGDVPSGASVVFVGGSTAWKEETLPYWCANWPRVHVGRVNGYRMLRRCADLGAESCDGTGWGRGDKKQLAGLMQFLEEEEKQHGNGALGASGVRSGSLVGGNIPVNPPMRQTAWPSVDRDADDPQQ